MLLLLCKRFFAITTGGIAMKKSFTIFLISSLLLIVSSLTSNAFSGRYASDQVADAKCYYIYCCSSFNYMTAPSLTSGGNIQQDSLYSNYQIMLKQKFRLKYKRTYNS